MLVLGLGLVIFLGIRTGVEYSRARGMGEF